MRTELIHSSSETHPGYGAGSGEIERSEFKCPCGKGKIVEEHDRIPGFREHDVWLQCEECSKKYRLDISKGVGSWELVEI